MEYRENPMFGRRVFFLNPPLSVENSIIPSLKDEEYEVYIIREYSLAKPVLKANENAICFIFIDDELSLDAWFNFIKSFENDESLKSIFLGVISIKTKPKDQERFLMELKLPGGFVMLDKKMENVTQTLEGILKINGAKGVRKCIRLDLKDTKDVNGYFTNGSALYSLKLVDISALGFATVVPAKMAPLFQKGKVITNLSITMKRFSFVCSIVVLNASVKGDSCVVVMMFPSDTSMQIKRKIHDFVFETLELRYRIFLEGLNRDMTDYNIRIRADGEAAADDETVTDAEAVEDVQEITESEEVQAESEVKTEPVEEKPEEGKADSAPEVQTADSDKKDEPEAAKQNEV